MLALPHLVDPMEQLVQVQWLGQIVGGPGLDGAHRGLDSAVGGHDDHCGLWSDGADAFEHLQPGQIRHLLIGEDEIEGLLLEAGEGNLAARGLGHLEATLGEKAGHELALGRLVVHHQDPERLSHDSFMGEGLDGPLRSLPPERLRRPSRRWNRPTAGPRPCANAYSNAPLAARRGSVTRKRLPPSGGFSASIRPPWASTIRRAMASPSPSPLAFVVT